MGKTVEVRTEDHTIVLNIDKFPDTCPLCFKGIDPRFFDGNLSENHVVIEVVFQCPRSDCHHLFIAYYYARIYQGKILNNYYLQRLAPYNFEPHEMSEIINSVSKDFVRIYNQSEQAESEKLTEIAGPGYRKSLEFLIKDFVIIKKPDKKDEVIKSLLGTVISSFVEDTRIQATAKRAAWLGNDETHYYRKWEDKDIKDLKILIDLTVRWIESVQLTEEYTKTMPTTEK
jgi:hypothetical protein